MTPTYTLLLGGAAGGTVYRWGSSVQDAGVGVRFRAVTQIFAPNGWKDEALFRTVTVVVSSTVGVDCRLTPIIDGLVCDGAAGRPDSRVAFSVPVPAAGARAVTKQQIGLFLPVIVAAVAVGRMGLRGTWVQVLLESTSEPVLPSGETNVDLRFDGIELDFAALAGRQQTVGP